MTDISSLSATDRLVLLFIELHLDAENFAVVPIPDLASLSSQTSAETIASVKRLESAGFLEVASDLKAAGDLEAQVTKYVPRSNLAPGGRVSSYQRSVYSRAST